jgi:hypothetical protein
VRKENGSDSARWQESEWTPDDEVCTSFRHRHTPGLVQADPVRIFPGRMPRERAEISGLHAMLQWQEP